MNTYPINEIHTNKQLRNKAWTRNLKDILYQAGKSIHVNKSEHSTITLAMAFHKPAGEENTYFWLGYVPHTIF